MSQDSEQMSQAVTMDIERIQTSTITDEDIQRARELIGVWLRRDVHWPATYEPISPHDIRRWAMYSVGDDNPLWSSMEYGRRTIWGSMIAPPTFLYTIDSTIVAPGFGGIQWIHGGNDWEFYDVIRPGDTIVARARLLDVIEKSGQHARRFVIQRGEVLYSNQYGKTIARAECNILRVPRARSGQGMQGFDGRKTMYHYSPEEIAEIDRAYQNEYRRGADTLYWEDVSVGSDLPAVPKGPLTLVDIVGFYAGRRNVYNVLKLAFAERRRHPANVYVSPKRGIPVHPAAGHFDVEIAEEVGMPGAYDQGFMRVNWLGHLVTNWMGDQAFFKRLKVENRLPNLVGDMAWCRGRIVDKRVAEQESLVDVEIWIENQRGETVSRGMATVQLQSRDPKLNP